MGLKFAVRTGTIRYFFTINQKYPYCAVSLAYVC